MAALSLSAVAVGVYTALNVSALTTLVGTRIEDHFPRTPTYPFVYYAIDKDEARGMGTAELPELTVRVSTFSTSDTMAQGQAIVAAIEGRLTDATLTISGYRMAGKVVWRGSTYLGVVDDVNKVPVHEWVSQFSLWCEV